MKKITHRHVTILLCLILFAGIGLLSYPTVSNYWNSFHQTKVMSQYAEQVEKMDQETYENIRKEAEEYNKKLLNKKNRYRLSKKEKKEYQACMNPVGTGIMGYIEIPSIHANLAIYHGTDESVLQVGIGHLEGTSLPIGGESTHCVLSGHCGLPSARLFTDLEKLEKGDEFILHVLNERLAYKIDQIRIVEPKEVDELEIIKGKDYCTLITCTPYGINSHRLLVRGHRTEESQKNDHTYVSTDAVQLDRLFVGEILGSILLIIAIIIMLGMKKTEHFRKRRW